MARAFPNQAADRLPEGVRDRLIDSGRFETFKTVDYVGINGGTPVSGSFVEIDRDTWSENDIFTFRELSETIQGAVLFDATRNVMVTLDYTTNDVEISFGSTTLHWEIVDQSTSLTPEIPGDWLLL